MTGYTVHTGSTEQFSQGWDEIFSKKKAATKTTAKKTTAKKAAGKPKAAAKKKAKK